jgi:hypothetical protein
MCSQEKDPLGFITANKPSGDNLTTRGIRENNEYVICYGHEGRRSYAEQDGS